MRELLEHIFFDERVEHDAVRRHHGQQQRLQESSIGEDIDSDNDFRFAYAAIFDSAMLYFDAAQRHDL